MFLQSVYFLTFVLLLFGPARTSESSPIVYLLHSIGPYLLLYYPFKSNIMWKHHCDQYESQVCDAVMLLSHCSHTEQSFITQLLSLTDTPSDNQHIARMELHVRLYLEEGDEVGLWGGLQLSLQPSGELLRLNLSVLHGNTTSVRLQDTVGVCG